MAPALPPSPRAKLAASDVVALARKLCNWATWGEDDQRGTVNHITPQVTAAAAALVRRGVIHSLSVPVDRDGPVTTSPRRFNPLHFMTVLPTEQLRDGGVGISDDVVVMPLQSGTQWDGLAHFAFDGQIYGGRPATLVSSSGAAVNDVRNFSDRLATRGVLADVARFRGVSSLQPGEPIEVEELQATLHAQGVDVSEGGALLVRTGYLSLCRARGWTGFGDSAPGLAMSTLEWIHDRHLAAVATDTYAVEVKPYQAEEFASPFHVVALVFMGLLLGEIFDLEQLSEDCTMDGVYEFFFVAPALPVTGAVGAPVNPYAIK